ncbi:MAG: MBL fold metallo-hydrolase [Anaerolineaceae bacterium]
MDIYFLGTGTAIPAKQHAPAGILVIANGLHLLLDIGPGTLTRLDLAGFACDQIDRLLLTHFHPDHTLDLATLLQVFNSAPGAARTKTFPITGCRGCNDFVRRLFDLYPDVTPMSYKLEIHQVYRDEFTLGNIKVTTAPTGHTPESVAYRLDDSEHSLVYSGDASPGGELAQLANGADLLIGECSFPAGWETEDHLNADMVGAIAQQSGVKSLVVTHFYPPALTADLIGQIHNHYKGKVQVAVDGLHLSL